MTILPALLLTLFSQVELRGSDAPLAAEVVSVSMDGVLVRSTSGQERMLGWETVRSVSGDYEAQAAHFAEYADKAWRARARLVRADSVAAEPLFEELFVVYEGRQGPTAAGVAEGLLRCRLRRGVQAGAVEPWLALVRAGVSTGAAIPGAQPILDPQTNLAPSLPPIWLPGPAVDALARTAPSSETDRAGLLRSWYVFAAALDSGHTASRPPAPGADPALQLVSNMILARAGSPQERAAARQWLRDEANRRTDTWIEAWCRAALGRSLIRESDIESKRLGIIELLHLPARFDREQSYLAGLCLAEAAMTLSELGNADGASRLFGDLADRFPGHPALALDRLRSLNAPQPQTTEPDSDDLPPQSLYIAPAHNRALTNSHPRSASSLPIAHSLLPAPHAPFPSVLLPLILGAQPEAPPPEEVLGPEDRVERYLERMGLNDLLAAQLRDRLARAPSSKKIEVAERLGKIYAAQLRTASTQQERERVEALARELLAAVPTAQSFDLRIDLSKAAYLKAEEIAERARLLLATPEDLAEAERILRQVRDVFRDIGAEVNRRVESLERQEKRQTGIDLEEIQAQLTEARRLRSLSMYYSGWSSYYLGEMIREPNLGAEAIASFAWLLNAGGERQYEPDKVPGNLLRYDHVARAAIGVALCHSLRGDDAAAVRWLDLVRNAEELSDEVRAQLFARRAIVYARARRWADLEWMLHVRARDARPAAEKALSVPEARLLAVLSLSALGAPGAPERADLVRALAQVALGELVNRGEVGHVLDLVRTFGEAPIGSDGFIIRYVRGLQKYDDARKAHAQAGESDQEPTSLPTVAVRYREAASLLRQSTDAVDVATFPAEAARAAVMTGLALFYAGDLEQAADRLQSVAVSASVETTREEALWYAIVALDRAVETTRPALAPRRDELSALFLQSFPRSERAARLLIRTGSKELVDPEEAVRVLLGVEADSPLYRAARSHAATLLYRIYRAAPSSQRDFAAMRFVDVAEEVVNLERAEAAAGDAREMADLGKTIVLRLRQIADALLSVSAPDASRAARTLELIEETADVTNLDLSDAAAELAYRRLQVALARSDRAAAESAIVELRREGGKYAEAADNLIYREALSLYLADPQSPIAARELLRHGLRIADTTGARPSALRDPAMQSVFNRTSEAAALLWDLEADTVARDISVRLDSALLAQGVKSVGLLQRHARLSEAAGNAPAALESWRTLAAGTREGSEGWYEARYNSARLLADIDAPKALELLDQHAVLYPDYGPQPWGAQLRALHERLRTSVPVAPARPQEGPP